MELIIKDNWSKDKRIENINNYIQLLGIELFKKCQKSKNIDAKTFEKITMNLCISYIKSLVLPYVESIDYGSFSIDVGEFLVTKVGQLANKIQEETTVSL